MSIKNKINMKILFDITHPGHVHLFKNVLWSLENKGHEILVTTLDKDITIKLLELYNIEHTDTSNKEIFGLIGKWGIRDFEIFKIARKFNPDILMGVLNPCTAHVATLLRKKSIIFNDTEHAKFAASITYPLTSTILTPSCFKKDLGAKQVSFNGFKELAYLHPNHFKPDPEVLDELNLNKDDKFIIMRMVAWRATHDIGENGFGDIKEIIKEIEDYGRIFVTSEAPLHKDFEKYRIKISPEKMHSLLAFAHMQIGESCTMATEAGVLGVPSIHITSAAELLGNFEELEKYGLVYTYTNQKHGLEKALELLKTKNLKNIWKMRREKLLKEKIDVTEFMVNFIENYPESFYEYQKTNENV